MGVPVGLDSGATSGCGERGSAYRRPTSSLTYNVLWSGTNNSAGLLGWQLMPSKRRHM